MDQPLLALTRPLRGGIPGRTPRAAAAENMRQLIQLRWIAAAGQLLAILVAHFGLGVTLPLGPMIAVVALLALINLIFAETLKRSWMVAGEVAMALLVDMLALTVQLYLSGGAANPFIALYLVQIVLGAILLRPAHAALLVFLACCAWIFLSYFHWPLSFPQRLWSVEANIHLIGSWISFAMVAGLLVLFITRITRNLNARDSYLAEMRERSAEEDGIVRMGLFASGAAHELGTPLSSLAVLLADWKRSPEFAANPMLVEELTDAQGELDRCKEIVGNILHSAGQLRGEAMEVAPVEELINRLAAQWRSTNPNAPVNVRCEGLVGTKIAAEPALHQAIWTALENAADVTANPIELHARIADDQLIISVKDDGPGFAPDQLGKVGRIGQSSKGPGHGLGLFIANNVVRRLGGRLAASNRDGGGAIVEYILPLASNNAADG